VSTPSGIPWFNVIFGALFFGAVTTFFWLVPVWAIFMAYENYWWALAAFVVSTLVSGTLMMWFVVRE
jgi:hypothetical protein